MMEVYGRSTRLEALDGAGSATEAWEKHLMERVKTANRYDTEIELTADYRPKNITRPEDVWQPIANIKRPNMHNVADVAYAKRLIRDERTNYFQRRF